MALQPRRPVAAHEILAVPGCASYQYASAVGYHLQYECASMGLFHRVLYSQQQHYTYPEAVSTSQDKKMIFRVSQDRIMTGASPLKSCKSTEHRTSRVIARLLTVRVHVTGCVDHDLRGRVGGNSDLIFGGSELESWPGHCMS
jgi:hypothetical protein